MKKYSPKKTQSSQTSSQKRYFFRVLCGKILVFNLQKIY